jgi:heat shock protein HslJ
MRSLRTLLAVVAMALVLPLLAACGGSDSSAAASGPAGGDLAGSWSLTSAATSSVDLSAFAITLELAAPNASGFGGVNQYTTTFTSTAEGGLEFGPIASTKMAGPDDAMAAEQAYFTALDSVTGYTVVGGDLQLFAGEQVVLTYVRQ